MTDQEEFESELAVLGITLEEFTQRYLKPWAESMIEQDGRFVSRETKK